MKRLLKHAVAATAAVVTLAVTGVYLVLRASLPMLEGEQPLSGLQETVQVERDARGVVTLTAQNRPDLAYALGFVHGQERFFQMDLLRRSSAGELAELLGPALLDTDRQRRLFRLRQHAAEVFKAMTPEEHLLFTAYSGGVNAGLKTLKARPFEYLLLSQQPQDWAPADSLLVLYSMFLTLSDPYGERERQLAALTEQLPPAMVAFLNPPGSRWEAPLIDEPPPAATPTPSAAVYDLRTFTQVEFPSLDEIAIDPDYRRGSNNWALAGSRAAGDGALVAGDMHLSYRVPHIWYRNRFRLPAENGDGLDVTGVTLPGLPFMVTGSNGYIAWALTTTNGDWSDLVKLELNPADSSQYRTPDGWQSFTVIEETLRAGENHSESLTIRETLWGPVIEDSRGNSYALHWLAQQGGVNAHFMALEQARNVEQALAIAKQSGLPPQNFVVGDREGSIGWTVAARIPRRMGIDGQLPAVWHDGSGWQGFLAPAEYPQVVNPASGQLWSANARMLGGDALKKIGIGGYAVGARQQQIRDALFELEGATPADMFALQLDDRALFLQRWQSLLLALLDDEALAAQPIRRQARALIEDWGARAAADSVGYRLLREWRQKVHNLAFAVLLAPCKAANPDCGYSQFQFHSEVPLWALVNERPSHLLHPEFISWKDFLLAAFDAVILPYTQQPGGLAARSWGERNTLAMRHPLSKALPWASRLLDMPAEPMSGDSFLPRVQLSHGGASQRMAVTPGREEEGIFTMPGGQSGHPLSKYYRSEQADWMADRPVPFLPGPAEHTLQLLPGRPE